MKFTVERMKRIFISLLFLLLVTGWGFADQPSKEELQTRYLAACEDAKIAEPGEISTHLTAIVDYNKDLITREKNGQKQVLVVTWTMNYYDQQVGQAVNARGDIWVTVVPELKSFCHALRLQGDSLRLRLNQLLGLPPDVAKTRVVEMWVSPNDLFRPCPDPEITDHEAQLDFPNSMYITVSSDHMKWINDLKALSYTGATPYPWTRLGYTYDWGNPESEIGLSEFVIRKGASIEISSSVETGIYCN